jgi:hypothetical protein
MDLTMVIEVECLQAFNKEFCWNKFIAIVIYINVIRYLIEY